MSRPNDGTPRKVRSRAVIYGLALALTATFFATLYWLSQGTDRAADPSHSKPGEIRSYAIGYGLALALTGAAFATVRWPSFAAATTLAIVLGLALIQMAVHFRFFLHISLRESARDDLQLILFSALIVILMVAGTLVVLFNLRARMS